MTRDKMKEVKDLRMNQSSGSPLAIGESDKQEVLKLYQSLMRSRAKLIGPDGTTQRLPDSLHAFLSQLIADLFEGRSVSIIQKDAQLTTVEAANILGVSRQFLVKLLMERKMPYHEVGTHRRIYMKDLLAFKAARDGKRRTTLKGLTRAEVEAGQYEVFSPDDNAG